MDQNEIARRLERVRDQIRDELKASPPPRIGAATPLPPAAELADPDIRAPVSEPSLTRSEHLESANDLAVITDSIDVRSSVPLLGPLLTLLRRCARPFVQPFLDPYLARQEKFNTELVRHLNQFGVAVEQRLAATQDLLFEMAQDPRQLEARLDAALESYDEALRDRHGVLFDVLEEELWGLRGALDDLYGKHAESMHFLEVRFVERAQAIDARFDEKDKVLEQLQSRTSNIAEAELLETRAQLARVLDELQVASESDGRQRAAAAPAGAPQQLDGGLWRRLREWMGDEDYRAFQLRFRGDEAEITRRLRAHVARFDGVPGPVADLGCGRGEFLELLETAGNEAIGIEINAADVASCIERGLQAECADLFDWLSARQESSLGGIFLAQVIEHIPPPDWSRLTDLAASRLAPGGRLVVETINPESLFALVRAYVLDPTHTRPVHPQLLSFMAYRSGLTDIDIVYQAEVPEVAQVARVQEAAFVEHAPSLAVVRELNLRIDQVNEMYAAPQEYALIASRVGATSEAS